MDTSTDLIDDHRFEQELSAGVLKLPGLGDVSVHLLDDPDDVHAVNVHKAGITRLGPVGLTQRSRVIYDLKSCK